jgi:hypothetical protein
MTIDILQLQPTTTTLNTPVVNIKLTYTEMTMSDAHGNLYIVL